MKLQKTLNIALVGVLCLAVVGCGPRGGRNASPQASTASATTSGEPLIANNRESAPTNYEASSIWDVFGPNKSDQSTQVNRYLWSASLDVLSFLPVQSVDPFTGVIVTGYGVPPGGGRSYRATVHVKDPALEARSLNVSLHTKGGPASAATTRAVEDAILSRARQLRIADRNL
ncbi:DUF3576 domain-containing protein [Aliisedimentitalea scapharcae]|uniref:DUF3576 domain-containing protein n=1 Tax=Aliisedimentitalea scapharcae TaxID=1524259 RepID=A0ABZ2XRX3_9RHOB|nr:DUF3576 domain-containing protein [Rhodobacteraceae bacterium M382]